MRRLPHLVTAAVSLIAGLATLAGCSSGSDGGQTSTSKPSASPPTAAETVTVVPGDVQVSPNGVTTAVGAPAESTEEEYFQACLAAKVWMDQQGGDPKSQIEPYLKSVQSNDAQPGPATFGSPWSQLPPARQAAVIVAVQAAADALC